MIRLFRKRPNPALWLSDGSLQGARLSAAIAVPFVFGILLGCVVGLFSERFPPDFLPLSFFSDIPGGGNFGKTLFQTAQYILLAMLCSSCVLGFIFLPVLAFLRGFFFSGAVSALYAAGSYTGLATAALSVGLPALLGVTAFLLTACVGLRFSLELLSSAFPGGRNPPYASVRLHYLLPVPVMVLMESCYFQWILPRWLS